MSYDETVWSKDNIWASIRGHCCAGTDEWETDLIIHYGQDEIVKFTSILELDIHYELVKSLLHKEIHTKCDLRPIFCG